jgi:glycosyltransferase involved in cell wall biosynthesis
VRITVCVMTPVFPDAVHDGSQKVLRTVCAGLGRRGHEVTVLCTRRDGNDRAFELAEGVRVEPALLFKQSFPQPHETAPYRLADVTARLRGAVAESDVLYVHGGRLLFDATFENTPAVVALHDLVYGDTLAAAFTFRRDLLITPSEYLRQCTLASLTHLDGLESHLIAIPNGFDTAELRPLDATRLRRRLGLEDDAVAILWPHRAHPRKGLIEALQAVAAARDRVDAATASRMRLLVPRWNGNSVPGGGAPEYEALLTSARRRAVELGAPDLLHEHPWLGSRDMPAYYSLGAVTLCLGAYVESFGNVSIESLLCDTPAVVVRVGAHRTVLPHDLVDKVDYGDIDGAADRVAHHVSGGARAARDDVAKYVEAHYSLGAMLDAYELALATARRIDPLPIAPIASDGDGDVLELPPWCALTERGLYNDYSYGYLEDPRLLEVAARARTGVTAAELLAKGVREAELRDWVSGGALVRHPASVHPTPPSGGQRR